MWIVGAVIVVAAIVSASERGQSMDSKPPTVDVFAPFDGDQITGSRGPEHLTGTPAGEMLFAFGGDDVVEAGEGGDLIDAGNGDDVVYAGSGSDRIRAFDGYRDVIYCGREEDTVFADPNDVTVACEELFEGADPSSPATPDPPASDQANPSEVSDNSPLVPERGTVVVEDRAWVCRGPVDLDLVKVTIRRRASPLDAISLAENCTGRIGRVEVDTWSGDGIKVQNTGVVAHDVVIESGYVRCWDRTEAYHQDGIHVMGGSRITFRELRIFCGRPGVNANLFIAQGGADASVPTDVVFEYGRLGPNASHTILLADAVRSGARATVICPGRNTTFRVEPTARAPVDSGNAVPPVGESLCRFR